MFLWEKGPPRDQTFCNILLFLFCVFGGLPQMGKVIGGFGGSREGGGKIAWNLHAKEVVYRLYQSM